MNEWMNEYNLYHFCCFRCVKQCKIAVNSVINWSFFYYICCFSISLFPRNFIDSESGETLCNHIPIRRPDTWRHSTCHRPLPTYWRSFGTKPLSPALFELLASKCIWVTTLTFLGHVTSSVTWIFDSQVPISYRWSLSWSLYLQPFSWYWPLSVLGSRPWPFEVTWRHRSRDHLIFR